MWTDYALDGSETQRDTMRAAMDRMADHRRTTLCTVPCAHPFTPRHALALFRISTAYIAGALTEDCGMPTVVVTHQAPSTRSLSAKLKADHLAGAFASRLLRQPTPISGACIQVRYQTDPAIGETSQFLVLQSHPPQHAMGDKRPYRGGRSRRRGTRTHHIVSVRSGTAQERRALLRSQCVHHPRLGRGERLRQHLQRMTTTCHMLHQAVEGSSLLRWQ